MDSAGDQGRVGDQTAPNDFAERVRRAVENASAYRQQVDAQRRARRDEASQASQDLDTDIVNTFKTAAIASMGTLTSRRPPHDQSAQPERVSELALGEDERVLTLRVVGPSRSPISPRDFGYFTWHVARKNGAGTGNQALGLRSVDVSAVENAIVAFLDAEAWDGGRVVDLFPNAEILTDAGA